VAIQVRFHRLATKETADAKAWYAARSPESAQRFLDAVLATADRIAKDRTTHAIGRSKYRYSYVRGFPYRLIYRVDASSVAQVVTVMHNRRRPGYWRHRK
jgi:plasmid stabilization system protein ParE